MGGERGELDSTAAGVLEEIVLYYSDWERLSLKIYAQIYMCDQYKYFLQSFKDGVTDMNSFYIGAHRYFLNKDNDMSSKEHGADISLHS